MLRHAATHRTTGRRNEPQVSATLLPARRVALAAAALAASLACAGAAAATPPEQAQQWEDAQDLYSQCKWSAAYRRFATLADEGQTDAAIVALLMVRYGQRLYGHAWSASPSQIDRWTKLSLQRLDAAVKAARD